MGFVATPELGHESVSLGVRALARLSHRGGLDADGKSGDGAGLLIQVPRRLLGGASGVAALFEWDERARQLVEDAVAAGGMHLVAWREVPIDLDSLGERARETMPAIWQGLVEDPGIDGDEWEHRLYLARRRAEKSAESQGVRMYIPSCSSRTLVYKGLMAGTRLADFYLALRDAACESRPAVFHQRYSTNTMPDWRLAQPFRMLAHNGEINTVTGNRAWMRAREAELEPELRGAIWPEGSDSASLDNALELLVQRGWEVSEALMSLVPDAWEGRGDLASAVRDFYRYQSIRFEPWDGPAALAFSDGVAVGAALDRNGLRPARFVRTKDDLIVMASEAGVLDIAPERILEKGRLGPGQMLVVDTARGAVVRDHEVKAALAQVLPYGAWVRRHLVRLGPVPLNGAGGDASPAHQRAFGYTLEDVERILRPMVQEGKDPVFSMGDDIPPAVLSTRPRLLYQYFKQRFAQVTNPPIDPLRERTVMSLAVYLGPRPSFLEDSPAHAHLLQLPSPILLPDDMRWLQSDGPFPVRALPARFPADAGPGGLAAALQELFEAAAEAARDAAVIVLSDRGVDARWVPIPMLLAVAAVHHELIRRGLRMRTSLIAETGEARDIHQFACLIGYGASAICPYLALQTLAADPHIVGNPHHRWAAYRTAVDAGLRKIMSKMGISTLSAYCGAQLFEAVGLDRTLVTQYFPDTPSRLDGIGLTELAAEALDRHRAALSTPHDALTEAGLVRFRRDGEYHAFNPYVVKAMHRAIRTGDAVAREALIGLIASRPPATVRDLIEFIPQVPVPLEEVEPVEAILRRCAVSAVSHGALGREAHETLATAANRIGARSNSGEGGEDPQRYRASSNSRIKQIASARFGVTPEYILSADELEIKMAQGSKPGEGGQLPGHKVSAEIARIRRAQAGITLISPPPHHDIYSNEELAQLIYDLKRIHPRARVAVKLVAEAGVGTIAAGVAKGFADTIQISGHDGGTGASPLDSIKNAGVPWELGLAEAQQVLVGNDLRGRVRLRVDGGLKIGRDIVIAALLGADEYGFGSAAVVALGCVMARQCHLNTCPVGIATQQETLRAKFSGTPEMGIAYLSAVAAH